MTSEAGFSWEVPTEHGAHHIEIELDHPVNPWEHDGAGRITWGASLDRLAPLGEEAVSIIKEAWDQRSEEHRSHAKREHAESRPVDRVPASEASMRPGWAARIELDQYWVQLTLYQPVNQRWHEEAGTDWSRGRLIDDGVLKRGVTVEATTDLGRRALRIVEVLHSAHPFNGSDKPPGDDWYR